MSKTEIPVENIYYLLSYAWGRFPDARVVGLAAASGDRVANLLAVVLASSVAALLKRGMDRSYITITDPVAGIRGKLELGSSLKSMSFPRGMAICSFDELSADTLPNQIIKTTLRRLARATGLAKKNADTLRVLYRRLPTVSEVQITEGHFSRLALHRNNRHYQFALNVCELVHGNLLPEERGGALRFRDFTKVDAEMARIFERFLRNFFRAEQHQFRVDALQFRWQATGTAEDLAHLPELHTDIVLRSKERTIVIDAKYYAKMLSSRFDHGTIRSGHLYQLYSYLHQLPAKHRGRKVEGMLIYPRTTDHHKVRFETGGYEVTAGTIDLSSKWPEIRSALLAMVS